MIVGVMETKFPVSRSSGGVVMPTTALSICEASNRACARSRPVIWRSTSMRSSLISSRQFLLGTSILLVSFFVVADQLLKFPAALDECAVALAEFFDELNRVAYLGLREHTDSADVHEGIAHPCAFLAWTSPSVIFVPESAGHCWRGGVTSILSSSRRN